MELGDDGLQACAADGTCYQTRRLPPPEGKRFGQTIVERKTPGAGWRVEADLNSGTPSDLAVDPGDSVRAVLANMGSASYRTPAGEWRPIDLIEIASDPPLQRQLVEAAGSLPGTGVNLLLVSLLGWLLVPWLSAKWVLQVLNLLLGGAVFVFGILASPLGRLTVNLWWLGFMAALTGLMRLSWWLDRRPFRRTRGKGWLSSGRA